MGFFKEDIANIKAFVFDVDGVLSSGELLINEEGDLLRTANIKDGFAMKCAMKQGFPVGIITGGNNDAVAKRYEKLGIEHFYIASNNKAKDMKDFIEKTGIPASQILYMGDDLIDIEVMKMVGMPTCPNDAVHQIKSAAAYISEYKGGQGCARDVIEQTLSSQGKWDIEELIKNPQC